MAHGAGEWSLHLQPPEPAVQRALYEQMGTSEEQLQRDAQVLRLWLAQHLQLPAPVDERWLRWSLVAGKGSVEGAKKVLDAFFCARAAAAAQKDDMMMDRDPLRPELQAAAQTMCLSPLPRPTPAGWRLVCFKVFDAAAAPAALPPWLKLSLMGTALRARGDPCLGVVLLADLAGVGGPFLAALRPTLLRKYLNYSQNIYKAKVKEVHLLNAPSNVQKIILALKPFVKEKIMKRVVVHWKGYDELLEKFPQEILPEDFGGTLPPLRQINQEWFETIVRHRDWFEEEEGHVPAASGSPKDSSLRGVDFGVEGSFRRLDID